MKNGRKSFAALFLLVLFALLAVPQPAQAMQPSPTSAQVIVKNPPEDLTIFIEFDGERHEMWRDNQLWEEYYIFAFERRNETGKDVTFVVSGGGYDFTVSARIGIYYESFVLDLQTQTLKEGNLHALEYMAGVLWIVLILLAKSLFFFCCGFRRIRSWLVILGVNTLMYGLLAASLAVPSFPLNVLSFFEWLLFTLFRPLLSLLPVDLGIVMAVLLILLFWSLFEAAAFLLLIKEHKKEREKEYRVGLIVRVAVSNLLCPVLAVLLLLPVLGFFW
ncbi:MAG: hypothetical protein FWD39_03440 [Clostridiales bacterium]|nr:hypothetical protein [Clostridiales bacterium]